MVGESCLLEKAGSKRHANYTLECSFPGTSCFCFKSNYLDSWPNDCLPSPQDDPAACLLARSYFCKKASKIIIEMIACCRFSPLLEEETIGICLDKEDPQVTLAVLNLLTHIVKSPSITSLLCSHQGEISLGIHH